MFLNRTLKSAIQKANKFFPVILVTGPRQVGKTTLLQSIKEKERIYVTLDDLIIRSLANEDPALFLQKYPAPVIIDEIQYAPNLLSYIKMQVDKDQKPGMFWLTGSQQFHLMKGVSESLAGRVGILQLSGLSNSEINDQSEKSQPFITDLNILNKKYKNNYIPMELNGVYNRIWKGSFPKMNLHKEADWEFFYQSYISTYIERDIRDLAQIADEQAFLRFLRAAAARTGQLINYADMARDVGIDQGTAKKWTSILKTSGLIYILDSYHSNRTNRIIKTPKLYFMDTGLCSFLTNWQTPETLEVGAMSGAIFETFCVSEIIKSYWYNGRSIQCFFYRDKEKKEVDLLIEQNGTLYPIKFKKTASPNKNDIKNFSALNKLKIPIGDGAVICLRQDIFPLSDKANSIPVGLL